MRSTGRGAGGAVEPDAGGPGVVFEGGQHVVEPGPWVMCQLIAGRVAPARRATAVPASPPAFADRAEAVEAVLRSGDDA